MCNLPFNLLFLPRLFPSPLKAPILVYVLSQKSAKNNDFSFVSKTSVEKKTGENSARLLSNYWIFVSRLANFSLDENFSGANSVWWLKIFPRDPFFLLFLSWIFLCRCFGEFGKQTLLLSKEVFDKSPGFFFPLSRYFSLNYEGIASSLIILHYLSLSLPFKRIICGRPNLSRLLEM